MANEVPMPQLSDTMDEGKILSWLIKEGEQVERGDAIAEVATDKADLEVQSFHDGTLLKILVPEGSTVKVGSAIAIIGNADEAIPETTTDKIPEPSNTEHSTQESTSSTTSSDTVTTSTSSTVTASNGHRIKISPLAKNLALSHGVDYSNISGSGEGGRIVKRDIEESVANKPVQSSPPQTAKTQAPQPTPVGARIEPLSKMRQTIASRMVESKTTIPHFYVTTRIMMDAAKKLRASLKLLPEYEGITFNHLIIKAAALALRKVPAVNAAYNNGNKVEPQHINVGIVTAVSDGLLIPVLKQTDELPLADIVSEGKALVQRARTGRLRSDDLTGGTFSISNIGMYEVDNFSAIINPGQGSILAISSIVQEPVVVNNEVVPGSVMKATLSVDHRIIDGVVGGNFTLEFKRLLEDPVLLLA